MTTPESQPTATSSEVFVIVAVHNEADRVASTLAALADAFPGAPVWVADDGSNDGTAAIAEAAGATVVRGERGTPRRHGRVGKGGAVTLAARAALGDATARATVEGVSAGGVAAASRAGKSDSRDEPVAVLCDGDLGDSAALLGPLVELVLAGEADLTVAAFVRRVGGGMGLAVGFAGWAIERCCGLDLSAPISGQRALRASLLEQVLPFAPGFGMEIGMTIDAARAGARVREVELDLSHRATGRTLRGFLHRGRQLIDFVRVYFARR
jgi:glycosyltransferase involved in cell wall biosynthesis